MNGSDGGEKGGKVLGRGGGEGGKGGGAEGREGEGKRGEERLAVRRRRGAEGMIEQRKTDIAMTQNER